MRTGNQLARFQNAPHIAIERGAGAFLVAGNQLNMFLVNQGLSDIDGVPVVEGLTATVNTA